MPAAPRISDNPALEVAVGIGRRLETPVLALLATASGYYTARGIFLLETDGDIWAKIGVILVAVCVSAALFTLWKCVLAEAPLYKTGAQRRAAWPLVAAIAAFAVGTSTFFNCSGLFGEPSVKRFMLTQVETMAAALPKAKAAADAALAGRQALTLEASKFSQLASAEHNEAALTHLRGDGAVQGMLTQLASTFDAAANGANDKASRAEALDTDVAAKLSSLRTLISAKDMTLAEKLDAFADQAEAVRAEILSLARLEAASDVRTAQAAARELVRPALAPKSTVAARQKTAADALTAQAASLKSLDEYATAPTPPILLSKPFETPTIYEAVERHLDDFAPLVLVVLLIDLLPVPYLVLRMLSQSAMARDDVAVAIALADVRLGDALLYEAALRRLRTLQASAPRLPRPFNGGTEPSIDDLFEH